SVRQYQKGSDRILEAACRRQSRIPTQAAEYAVAELPADSEPASAVKPFLFAVSLVGIAHVAFRRRERGEFLFWLLVWTSVVASAGVVFFDDGLRVLSASYPLLCLFFAMGLGGTSGLPSHERQPDRRMLLGGGLTILAAGVLCFSVPRIAHDIYVSPTQE